MICGLPVTRIQGIAVTTVTVLRYENVVDEVVARQYVSDEVGMRAIARVDNRDHDIDPSGAVPRVGHAQAARVIEVLPLFVVATVIGREQRPHQYIFLYVLHFRVRTQGCDDLL